MSHSPPPLSFGHFGTAHHTVEMRTLLRQINIPDLGMDEDQREKDEKRPSSLLSARSPKVKVWDVMALSVPLAETICTPRMEALIQILEQYMLPTRYHSFPGTFFNKMMQNHILHALYKVLLRKKKSIHPQERTLGKILNKNLTIKCNNPKRLDTFTPG